MSDPVPPDTGKPEPAQPFGLDPARTMAVQMRIARRYYAMRAQLGTYFDLLIRLADKADHQSRPDLFDRIERTLAEMARRRITRTRLR